MEKKINPITGWVALCVSSVFFLGFLPGKLTGKPGKGGGMMGRLATVIPLAAMFCYSASVWAPAFAAVAVFLVGWIATDIGEQFMKERWGPGPRHTGEYVVYDRNETCVDEVCGMLIAGLPMWLCGGNLAGGLITLAFCLIVFSFWDIYKFWPVKFVEAEFRYSSFGVMLDDVVGGIMTSIIISVFCLPIFSNQ